MSSTADEHPLDTILRDFPGISRISEVHCLTAGPDEELPVVIAALAIARGDSGGFTIPECMRSSIRFVEQGFHVGLASDIHTGELIDSAIWGVAPGEPLRPYFIGLEPCGCSPVQGGPGVNPLCFALEDNGLTKAVTDRILRRWITVVRKQSGLFCREGIQALRQLHII